MSRYNSKIEEFNIEKFMTYISMYNMKKISEVVIYYYLAYFNNYISI